eukprot:12653825-Alexandrium_andersonii.AAC.1
MRVCVPVCLCVSAPARARDRARACARPCPRGIPGPARAGYDSQHRLSSAHRPERLSGNIVWRRALRCGSGKLAIARPLLHDSGAL